MLSGGSPSRSGPLAAAHLDARGQVGDTDPVQAVEDTLRSFPAQEVVFVTGPGHQSEVEEVRRRLDRPVRVLATDAKAGGVGLSPPGRRRSAAASTFAGVFAK